MRRAVVIRLRIADCELRIGTAGVRGPWRIPLIDPSPSNPQSAIRNPQLSYLPVGKQHAPGGMRLRIALVRHAQVGPAWPRVAMSLVIVTVRYAGEKPSRA